MTDAGYERRLRRGRRWWDLVSPIHGSAGGQTTRVAELALDHLHLEPGQTVIDLGCGSGAALPTLSAAVGPAGRVHGIDASPRMLARAGAVVRDHALTNVELREADAIRTRLAPGSADAVYACSSISAMPDVPAALAAVHAALRPGGRLFVFDVRLVPGGWSTPLIKLLQGVCTLAAGWAGVDVLDTAREVFAELRLPDMPGKEGQGRPDTGWPPLTLFVATRASGPAAGP